jgi:flagellar biosynthesis GTPase FlhF
MPETRTYQGATLEELLPQIRSDLGAGAVITRRREGVTGGFAGFFGKRCVEVEAQAAPVPAVPAQSVFDAYDSGREPAADENPVIRTLVEQASPFADALDDAFAREAATAPDPRFEELDLVPSANGAVEVSARAVLGPGWAEVGDELVAAGMPRGVADALVGDAETMLAPFAPGAAPAELVRRMIARTVRVEYGWRTKRRTIALVGPAGSGKSLTAAKLAHAFASRSPYSVRTVSLEPGAPADRLAALTAGLVLDRRTAATPGEAKAAVRAPGVDSVVVVDTPPVSAGDPDGIAHLGAMLAAMRPDETHLVTPAAYDARTLLRLHSVLADACPVNRILISRIDEAPSAAVAVGVSLSLKRPISYISDGRLPGEGLQPAEPTRLADLVMP